MQLCDELHRIQQCVKGGQLFLCSLSHPFFFSVCVFHDPGEQLFTLFMHKGGINSVSIHWCKHVIYSVSGDRRHNEQRLFDLSSFWVSVKAFWAHGKVLLFEALSENKSTHRGVTFLRLCVDCCKLNKIVERCWIINRIVKQTKNSAQLLIFPWSLLYFLLNYWII